MTRLFAIATSDASLMRCELERARHLVTIDGEGAPQRALQEIGQLLHQPLPHRLGPRRQLPGHGEQPLAHAEAPIAAQLLGRTAGHVEEAAGPANRPSLSLMATNGRIVAATTRGGHALFYRLLEGDGACVRCGLSGDEKAATPLVRDHRRRRSVLLATHPLKPDAWLRVADGRSVAVGRSLELQLV
jgi:hypothetical protein